jgi:hypothetical protein
MQLYTIILLLNTYSRVFLDEIALFIMATGFFIDVASNFVVLTMIKRIPFFLYFAVAILAIMVPIIMMGELPEAAACHDASIRTIGYFNGTLRSHQKIRKKTLKALRPGGFYVGIFFKAETSTTAVYVDAILDYTVCAVIST